MMDRTEAHRLVDQLEAAAFALATATKGSIAESRALSLLKTARARTVQALTGEEPTT